jgi:hypothetical protein
MKLQELFEGLFNILSEADILTIDHEPNDGIWYQHQSPDKFDIIKPPSYKELSKIRDKDYPIDDRKDHEDEYRKLSKSNKNNSFIYATIVGYHKFGKPEDYDGYTYYFQLSDEQLSKTVFEVVTGNEKISMKPMLGKKGLKTALALWDDNNKRFKTIKEKGVGDIFPRIEVIIPFTIKPSYILKGGK